MSNLTQQRASFRATLQGASVFGHSIVKPERFSTVDLYDEDEDEDDPSFLEARRVRVQQVLLTKQFDVIHLIKSEDRPFRINELEGKLSIPILGDESLMRSLTTNPKITHNQTDSTFWYNPAYNIRTKEDLLRVVKSQRFEGGLEVKELKDCYKGIMEAIDELETEKEILVIRGGKDNRVPKVLFWNDQSMATYLESDFVSMWHSTVLPHTLDVEKELRKVGIDPMKVTEKKPASIYAKKEKRKSNRRTKILNTHIKELDLQSDFVMTRKP